MTSVEQAPIEWTVEGLLAEIQQLHLHQAERALAFILGAGASVSSKIPAGGDLARKWLEECYQRECLNKTKRSLEDWSCIALGDADFTLADAASYYPQIFERRFGGDYASGYAALEDAMKDAKPGVGYAILAKILDKTQHRVVVTTNFDNLVADAMAIHARRQPLIVGHEALAGFAHPITHK